MLANNRLLHPPAVRRQVPRASSHGSTSTASSTSVWLPAREVERTVVLQLMPEKKGQAVVVVEVAPDSQAAQAGIVKGQKLVGISDPVRDTQVWDLGDRPSIRFVRDTLQMRRMGQVQLVLTDFLNATDPAWQQQQQPADTLPHAPAAGASPEQPATGRAESPGEGGAAASASLLDSLLSTSSVDDEPQPSTLNKDPSTMTIAEKMAAQYQARQEGLAQKTEVQKRIAKRAAYLDEVSQRNDTGLVAGLLAAFVIPPAVILAWAISSGYLDRLYNSALTLQ